MPRSCPICEHEDLDEINAALASNERIRTIAERWSVRKTALMRHRNEHLPVSAILAKEAKAEEAEELSAALQAIGEVKGNLKLMTKPLNELEERSVDENDG